jgi:hypothetical protein
MKKKNSSKNVWVALVAVLVIAGVAFAYSQGSELQGRLSPVKVTKAKLMVMFPGFKCVDPMTTEVVTDVPTETTTEVTTIVTSEVPSEVTSEGGTTIVVSDVPSETTTDVPTDVTTPVPTCLKIDGPVPSDWVLWLKKGKRWFAPKDKVHRVLDLQ